MTDIGEQGPGVGLRGRQFGILVGSSDLDSYQQNINSYVNVSNGTLGAIQQILDAGNLSGDPGGNNQSYPEQADIKALNDYIDGAERIVDAKYSDDEKYQERKALINVARGAARASEEYYQQGETVKGDIAKTIAVTAINIATSALPGMSMNFGLAKVPLTAPI